MGNVKSCCVHANGSTPKHCRDQDRQTRSNGTRPNGHFRRSASSASGLANGPVGQDVNGISPHPTLSPPRHEESCGNIQHISEREPDDWETDPSLHPTTTTLFMEKSKQSIQNGRSQMQLSQSRSMGEFRALKKSSSCSTIYIDDSTVTNPNLKNTIKCVSLGVYYLIKNRKTNTVLEIFDEKLHPLSAFTKTPDTDVVRNAEFQRKMSASRNNNSSKREGVPTDYDLKNPEHRQIYRFIRTLFNSAQLTAECAIITLVYLERLLKYAEIDITPACWKRITLGAVLLASKVWDDQAVWNVDYCQILRDITVNDMNELERQFLEMLQFNINVPSSVYAKYYFDLRTLAEANELTFPSEPLSKERALKLEAMAQSYEEKITQDNVHTRVKRCSSLDKLSVYRRSVAILS